MVAMAEDVPALKAMKPGGKEHPVDRTIHDGDTVTLGGAILTAGHTPGATTWTTPVTEGGKPYQVVFYSSLRSPTVLTPPVIDEFKHTFAVVRALPCDVPLGDHPSE
jgi:metallo-beta-lactamase class B